MKYALAVVGLVLLTSTGLASWEEDWEIDQAAGLAKREWTVRSPHFRATGQNSPLMRADLPPYDQQPRGAQDVPEPEAEEVTVTQTQSSGNNPNNPSSPNNPGFNPPPPTHQ